MNARIVRPVAVNISGVFNAQNLLRHAHYFPYME